MDFSNILLDWYDGNARSLPWRGSHDPYLIWVSEIIFQQTRIEQGTGYYIRFTERFPDLNSLAAAGEDEVLRIWQGLGYYSRARNMLETARYIHEHLGSVFPSEFEKILSLKGIGDYTASCIASICFGAVHAAVDGNVYRVLSRYYADGTPVDSGLGKSHFKKFAQDLISHDRPGDFNEAMMDLGAMVCKPRNPLCPECPVNRMCQSLERNVQEEFPIKSPVSEKSVKIMNYLFLNTGNQVIIRKRQGSGIWKGMYELPMVAGDPDAMDMADECMEQYGLDVGNILEISRIKHILSHQDLDIRFYSADQGTLRTEDNSLLTIPVDKIAEYPFPKPLADFLGTHTED